MNNVYREREVVGDGRLRASAWTSQVGAFFSFLHGFGDWWWNGELGKFTLHLMALTMVVERNL